MEGVPSLKDSCALLRDSTAATESSLVVTIAAGSAMPRRSPRHCGLLVNLSILRAWRHPLAETNGKECNSNLKSRLRPKSADRNLAWMAWPGPRRENSRFSPGSASACANRTRQHQHSYPDD